MVKGPYGLIGGAPDRLKFSGKRRARLGLRERTAIPTNINRIHRLPTMLTNRNAPWSPVTSATVVPHENQRTGVSGMLSSWPSRFLTAN
jgi:hypothetical protein